MATTPKLQLPDAQELNLAAGSSMDSVAWIRQRVKEIQKMKYSDKRFMVGKMYLCGYVPVGRYDLPYYDRFPLVLVLDISNDGFIGLNLHYLPPLVRYTFLNKLMRYATLTKDSEVYRVKISYDILNTTKRLKEFRPAIKKYLFTQLRTAIIPIPYKEWQSVLHLPLEKFIGEQKTVVWHESMQSIKKEAQNAF